jgi:prevent-host-death family protein
MRRAGVREARQDLTSLLDDVRKGREVVITERGRAVARLVPIQSQKAFPDLRKVRRKGRLLERPLSEAVLEDREDRE